MKTIARIALLHLAGLSCFAQQAPGLWTPTGIWTRLGVLPIPFSGGEEENQPGYGGDCVYVAGPSCWKMTFDDGTWTYYTEAQDLGGSIGPWAPPHGIILGLIQTTWAKVGSRYHMYGTNGASNQIEHWSGPNLAALALTDSAVIVPGAPGNFDDSHVYNPPVEWEGGILRMVYVGQGH